MNEQPKFENTFAATPVEPKGDTSSSLDRPETYEEWAIRSTAENRRRMGNKALKKMKDLLKDEENKEPKEPEDPSTEPPKTE